MMGCIHLSFSVVENLFPEQVRICVNAVVGSEYSSEEAKELNWCITLREHVRMHDFCLEYMEHPPMWVDGQTTAWLEVRNTDDRTLVEVKLPGPNGSREQHDFYIGIDNFIKHFRLNGGSSKPYKLKEIRGLNDRRNRIVLPGA